MAELPEPFSTPPTVSAQQAAHAIRGYVYQIYATGLAWLDLPEDGMLLVEVAEDYAILARGALNTVQVRDTAGSGPISLRTPGVIQAIENIWTLSKANSARTVTGIYLSTSVATRERPSNLPNGATGLDEWTSVQATGGSVGPIRTMLLAIDFQPDLKSWIAAASDVSLREDLLARMTWRLGAPALDDLSEEFARRVMARCGTFGLLPHEAAGATNAIFLKILSLAAHPGERRLDRTGLDTLIQHATLVLTSPRQGRQVTGRARAYMPPLDLRTRDDAAGRLFFFGATDRADFVGRKNELGLLHDWANQKLDFSWTLVAGVGGMGKSRLALELCLRLALDGWHAGFLAHGTALTEAAKFAEFTPSRPTLLVIDYVSLNPHWAGEVVRTLLDAATIEPFAFPVRVLLLERTGAVSPWFYDFSRNQQSRLMGRAARLDPDKGFIELRGLDLDDRWNLFRTVALGADTEREDLVEDLEWHRDDIEGALNEIDPKATPLFTALAAEATQAGRQIWQFNRRALLNDIFLREQVRWRTLAADAADLARHERAGALATMVGGLPVLMAAQHAAIEPFPFDQIRYNDPLVQAINGPSPSIEHIVAMEPDILGEWFVLRRLTPDGPFDSGPDALREAADRLSQHSTQMRWGYAGFRARLAQDFPDDALDTGLYEPPPLEAPPSTHATWLGLMANVIEDLATHRAQLMRMFDAILAARDAFPSDRHVQVNAVAAIGIYSSVQADTAAVIKVADLIDAVEWPPATLEFVETATGLSRAMLIVGRALATADETERALAIFESLRAQAWRCRLLPEIPVEALKHDAALLGLHIRASFHRRDDLAGVSLMNRKLWQAADVDHDDLAGITAQVLANVGLDEDLDAAEGIVSELQQRTRERLDLPDISGAAAQALFAAARDESYAYDFVEHVQALAAWLAPRTDNVKVRQILTMAVRAGWLDEQMHLGEASLRSLYEMWRAAVDAVNDAEEDPAEDWQIIELHHRLGAALDVAPDEDWANQMRVALLATVSTHEA